MNRMWHGKVYQRVNGRNQLVGIRTEGARDNSALRRRMQTRRQKRLNILTRLSNQPNTIQMVSNNRIHRRGDLVNRQRPVFNPKVRKI